MRTEHELISLEVLLSEKGGLSLTQLWLHSHPSLCAGREIAIVNVLHRKECQLLASFSIPPPLFLTRRNGFEPFCTLTETPRDCGLALTENMASECHIVVHAGPKRFMALRWNKWYATKLRLPFESMV